MRDQPLSCTMRLGRSGAADAGRRTNTLSASVEGADANALLLAAIEDKVVAASAIHVSHMLQAMRVPEKWAWGKLRFSTGRMTAEADIDIDVAVVAVAAERLRGDT